MNVGAGDSASTSPSSPRTRTHRMGRGRRSVPSGTPPVVAVLAIVALVFLAVPFVGLGARAPWGQLPQLVRSPQVVGALRLSLVTSLLAATISTILGVPLAWVLSRTVFPGKSLVRAAATLPMVLPPVVGGAALLFALGRRGLIGSQIHDRTGFALPFSMWGVVIAGSFVALPFVVITVEGALSSVDTRYEQAASTLGAGPMQVFRRIVVPSIAPSLRAGIILAWARALGEYGATVTFAGNIEGRTQTLPLAVSVALEQDRDAAMAMSVILVAISFTVLVVMRRHWWPAR